MVRNECKAAMAISKECEQVGKHQIIDRFRTSRYEVQDSSSPTSLPILTRVTNRGFHFVFITNYPYRKLFMRQGRLSNTFDDHNDYVDLGCRLVVEKSVGVLGVMTRHLSTFQRSDV